MSRTMTRPRLHELEEGDLLVSDGTYKQLNDIVTVRKTMHGELYAVIGEKDHFFEDDYNLDTGEVGGFYWYVG